MSKTELAEALVETGVIAAVQVPDEQKLRRAVAALVEGGIRAVELPYATAQSAGWLIHALKETGILVGVGVLTRSPQARESGMYGADFIASCVISADVVSACEEMDIPCFLTGLTPTEVWRAHEMKADFVKIVAAEALGGPHYVRSLREALPAQHLALAGTPLEGYLSYLEAGVEVLEFKGSLALPELAEREEWAEISQRASKVVSTLDNWKASRKPYS